MVTLEPCHQSFMNFLSYDESIKVIQVALVSDVKGPRYASTQWLTTVCAVGWDLRVIVIPTVSESEKRSGS